MNYFTSDWHLGHKNILKYDKRPFSSIEEHDKHIIDKYNDTVNNDDNVYFLGDIFYKCSKKYADYILNNLKGNKFFIRGNHCSRYIEPYKKHGTYLGDLKEITINEQMIVLCHYSMRVWNRSHHGTWHLYGHSHGSLEHLANGKSFDVAVHLWDYKPLSFEEIKEIMATKNKHKIDHH